MKKLFHFRWVEKILTYSDDFDKWLPPEDETIRLKVRFSEHQIQPQPQLRTPPTKPLNHAQVENHDQTPQPEDKWYHNGFRDSTSPENRAEILRSEIEIAQGNVRLLSRTLSDAQSEGSNDENILGFYRMCKASQKFISSQIPWAKEATRVFQDRISGNQRIANVDYEELLGSLLYVNKLLLDVLQEYEELQQVALEREIQGIHRLNFPHFSQQWQKHSSPSTSSREFGDFPRYSSSNSSPAHWLEEDHKHLLKYITQSGMNIFTKEQCRLWANTPIIFPHLLIYMCIRSVADAADLLPSAVIWKEWDELEVLCRHREINATILSFVEAPMQYSLRYAVKNIVALDIDVICARLYDIVKNTEKYRRLVNLQGSEAQAILDLFQTLLDLPMLDKIFRSPFLNAMLRLSTRSSLFPSLLLQQQVTLEGVDAIAGGQFGDIWKGRLSGQQVAVKVLKLYLNSDVVKHFKKVLHETLIWRQLRHPNVLPFLCIHHVNNNEMRIGLVSPWMENGNLKEFLVRTSGVDRVSLVNDVAKGLEYLHTMQPTIVHGDLKAVNILMSGSRRARLADFGLSTASDSQALKLSSFSSGMTGGTPRWMAPELLDGRQDSSNTKTDVYSFACVCFEIFSGSIPFSDLNDYPVMLRVMRGERPSRPKQCEQWKTPCTVLGLDDKLWRLVERCWAADVSRRPTMSNVVQELPPRKKPVIIIGTDHQSHAKSDPKDLITWAGDP